jgi:hypothetical protein
MNQLYLRKAYLGLFRAQFTLNWSGTHFIIGLNRPSTINFLPFTSIPFKRYIVFTLLRSPILCNKVADRYLKHQNVKLHPQYHPLRCSRVHPK